MHTGGKRYLAGPASGVTPQSRPAPTRNPADATLPPQIRIFTENHISSLLLIEKTFLMTLGNLSRSARSAERNFFDFRRKL